MYRRSPPVQYRPPPSSGGLLVLASVFAVVGAFLVGYVALEKMLEMQITIALHQASRKMQSTTEFTYRNVRVSLWERAVRINGISVRPPKEREALRIDRVSISGIDWETILRASQSGGAPTIPRTMRLGFEGLHLTPRMLGSKGANQLKQLGYEEIALSMSAGFLFDRRRKIFGIEDMNVELRDMGRLSFSVELGNVQMPSDGQLLAIKMNPETAKAQAPAMEDITLRSASLQYDDLSLIGRVDQLIKNSGGPGLAQMIEVGARMPAAEGSFMADAVKKIQAFVSSPEQSLRLSVQPNEPMPLDSLGLEVLAGPDKLAQKLNLKLEVQ